MGKCRSIDLHVECAAGHRVQERGYYVAYRRYRRSYIRGATELEQCSRRACPRACRKRAASAARKAQVRTRSEATAVSSSSCAGEVPPPGVRSGTESLRLRRSQRRNAPAAREAWPFGCVCVRDSGVPLLPLLSNGSRAKGAQERAGILCFSCLDSLLWAGLCYQYRQLRSVRHSELFTEDCAVQNDLLAYQGRSDCHP